MESKIVLYSITQAAEMTGRSIIGVRKIAQRTAGTDAPIGQKFGRNWLFTPEDIARLKDAPKTAGRPIGKPRFS